MNVNDPTQAANAELRLVFNNSVIHRPIGARTTLADIANAIQNLTPDGRGDPIAINVILGSQPTAGWTTDFIPSGMMFADDPAAVFEDVIWRGAASAAPDFVAQFRD